jgi:CheY-like chemotaxis protein
MTQRTILVVDDEPFICRSLTFVLRKDNYKVLEARNGEEALAAIKEHKPDLVFLDVMMPKINGFEVTERVRSDPELAGVKIILLTAKGQESDREVGKTAGANDYMTKPFSPTKILDARERSSGPTSRRSAGFRGPLAARTRAR